MPFYCVNKTAQANGDHEVHTLDCYYVPARNNRHDLGQFASCHGAVAKAQKDYYSQSNGCRSCSLSCHTS